MRYKIQIKYQTREYGSQIDARNALIELLDAGVFHVKTDTTDGKQMLICKGETTTFSNCDDAIRQLLKALKTHKIFYVETHILEDSSK